MKKVIKVILIIILIILLLAVSIFGIYAYRNLHWYDRVKKNLKKAGAVEKQVTLPSGNVINYGEVKNDKPALLLIHGQNVMWEQYASVLPELSKKWHIYAVDVYGHGESSHDESLYYLDVNGDDIIWFINNVIKEKTVVSGHSNGGLTAAYVAAYGGSNIAGVVLEDPPVFNTEGEGWEKTFAYQNSFKVMHDYENSDKSECWAAYSLRHGFIGQYYMKSSIDNIADYAQKYYEKHPGKPVEIFFLPPTMGSFYYDSKYDHKYGEHFYDLSWNHGLKHEQILSDIKVPAIYLHAKEGYSDNGVLLCAASRDQAERAVSYIGDNCTLIETDDSQHDIHGVHKDVYIDAVNRLLPE